MKNKISLMFLVLAGLSFVSFTVLQDWVSFSSKQGNYKMLFPSEPKEQEQKIPSAVGELTMYLAILESEDESASNLLYMSAYCAYPADKVNSDASKETLEKFFKGASEGSAKKINGEIRSMKDLSYKGFPGKDILIDANLGGAEFVIAQRLILVKNKFYMLQTFSPKEMETNPEAKKFLDSFTLAE